MIIPIIILLIIPALDRTQHLHPLDRPWITALTIVGLTWLIELSVGSAIQPGVPVMPSWAALVLLPPLVIVVVGIYVVYRYWVRIRDKVLDKAINGSGNAERGRATWVLSRLTAVVLSYVTAILAIIVIALSIVLNPVSEGPYIGTLWGSALLLLSASVLNYFYVSYM